MLYLSKLFLLDFNKGILMFGRIKKRLMNIIPGRKNIYWNDNYKKNNEIIPTIEEPLIFNSSGEKLHTFFLLDDLTATYYPYCFVAGRFPNYIHWDRYNAGLKTHFYTHQNVLKGKGNPDKKFAMFIESEALVPNDYRLFDLNYGLSRQFNKIFTHSEYLLDKYDNALFIPGGGVWYGTSYGGGVLDPQKNNKKNKNISIVSSNKKYCELHKYRILLAKKYRNSSFVDVYGTFDGGNSIKIAQSLDDYRYSIIMENCISSYYFTEKILNCFAAMTIPIYFGAKEIGKYFNIDGIIQVPISQLDYIDAILANCNEEDYNSRISAITDNYHRVQKYLCIENYLFETYNDQLI
jgi:hypothetical protein